MINVLDENAIKVVAGGDCACVCRKPTNLYTISNGLASDISSCANSCSQDFDHDQVVWVFHSCKPVDTGSDSSGSSIASYFMSKVKMVINTIDEWFPQSSLSYDKKNQ